MANKPQRYPFQYKGDQASCIRGFINVFDFRNGRSTKKLPVDRRQARTQVAGASSYVKLAVPNSSEMSSNDKIQDDDECEAAALDFKTSVKELMEEDMLGEPMVNNQRNDIHLKSSSFRKKDVHTDNEQSDQGHLVLEEKLSAAIEMLVSQKLKNTRHFEEDEIPDNSKELMDALKILSSNKELCWRLLQDSNSRLVKHIESLEDEVEKGRKSSSRLQYNLMQKNAVHAKKHETVETKPYHFFRWRSKSRESCPSMEYERSQPSRKIVILKPAPAGLRLHSPQTPVNKLQIGKTSSLFSFTEIKRRLKKAMGKEHQEISQDSTIHKKHKNIDKGISGENSEWSSPNRNHFYMERYLKPPYGFRRGDKQGKPEDIEEATINEASNYPKGEIPNIYLEAKKHLLEMLDNREKEEEFTSEKLGALSHPEDHTIQSNLEIQSSAAEINSKHDIEFPNARLDIPCELNCDNLLEKSISSNKTEVAVSGIQDREESDPTGYQEDEKVSNDSCEPSTLSVIMKSGNADVTEAFHKETSFQSSEFASESLSDSCGAKGMFSCLLAPPLHSSDSAKADSTESAMDRMEHPSPISVPELSFPETDSNPASAMYHPVELQIQPQKIHFEEPAASLDRQLDSLAIPENEDSPFEYVEAVLLGSGLNWDEFLLSWLSSDQIVDPSLFDEIELLSDLSCRKLLFDCTNEVLTETCDRYFGCFTGVLFVKPMFRPVPKGMDLIHEVWQGVEWYLLNTPTSHSLDELLKKDMARPAAWMDLKSDLENIGIGIEAAILEDLVEETLLSFANDTLEGNFIPPTESELETSFD